MRYLTLLRATRTTDGPPPPELMAAIMRLGEEATASGSLLDTAGLAPPEPGDRRTMRAGPHARSRGVPPSGVGCLEHRGIDLLDAAIPEGHPGHGCALQ